MELTVAYSARIEEPEPDRRHRLWVTLQRTDKPVTFSYHCMICGTKFPTNELVNLKPLSITDLVDTSSIHQGAIGVRCRGKYYDESEHRLINCPMWYYWSLPS